MSNKITTGKVVLANDVPQDLYNTFKKAPVLGVDTELHGLHPGRDRVVLIMIGDDKGNIATIQTAGKNSLPPRAKALLINKKIIKIAHFALVDYGMIKATFNIDMLPVFCTRTASKLVRTYTGLHGLKNITDELLSVKLDKKYTNTDWANEKLSPGQLDYAADDVRYLPILRKKLMAMIAKRGTLPNYGISLKELNEKAQKTIPLMAHLVLSGYSEGDFGWEVNLFKR